MSLSAVRAAPIDRVFTMPRRVLLSAVSVASMARAINRSAVLTVSLAAVRVAARLRVFSNAAAVVLLAAVKVAARSSKEARSSAGVPVHSPRSASPP